MAVLKANLVADQIRKCHGNLAAVGRFFGVTRVAVWNFVQARPTLKEVMVDVREELKDVAESALYKSILAGEFPAIKWYLACQARERGYVERQTVDNNVNMVEVDAAIREELRQLADIKQLRLADLVNDILGGQLAIANDARAAGLDEDTYRAEKIKEILQAAQERQAEANGNGDMEHMFPQPLPSEPPQPLRERDRGNGYINTDIDPFLKD